MKWVLLLSLATLQAPQNCGPACCRIHSTSYFDADFNDIQQNSFNGSFQDNLGKPAQERYL